MESKPIIIVVDDDPMIGRCLTMFLDGHNYRVIFFTDGNKALAYLANNTVNFLLTDLQMPAMTGLELLRQVKTLFPALPALVMSGSADGRDRDEIFSLGADFIAKPFDLADVLTPLERTINKDKDLSGK
jgi:DNA-binding response OmpR family regulator